MQEPDVRPRKSHHQPREPLWWIDPAPVQMEASVFQIRKQLFDPHPAAVSADRCVAGFPVGTDQSRIVLIFGLAKGETHGAVFVVFRHDDVLQVSSFSFLRNQISKLFPGPFLGKAFGGIFEGADVGVCVEPQAKMPSLILYKVHQISGMKRPVAYDHNLCFVGKPAHKRFEQGYLLLSVRDSFPSVRFPADRKGSSAISNPSHKHLPLSGKLHRVDQKSNRAAPLRFCSLGRPLNQAVSNRAVESLRINVFVSKKSPQVARLAFQLGRPSNPTGHLRKMNMLGQMQSGDHLCQSAAPGSQRLGKQLGKRRLHFTLDEKAVAHWRAGTGGSVIGSPQPQRSVRRGQRPSSTLAGIRKTVR